MTQDTMRINASSLSRPWPSFSSSLLFFVHVCMIVRLSHTIPRHIIQQGPKGVNPPRMKKLKDLKGDVADITPVDPDAGLSRKER